MASQNSFSSQGSAKPHETNPELIGAEHSRRFSMAWMCAIFALALMIRVLHLLADAHSPFFEFRGIDALDYHRMALGMHDGT